MLKLRLISAALTWASANEKQVGGESQYIQGGRCNHEMTQFCTVTEGALSTDLAFSQSPVQPVEIISRLFPESGDDTFVRMSLF